MITSGLFKDLIVTIGVIAHELGHQVQSLKFKTDALIIDEKHTMRHWNYLDSILAGELTILSLLVPGFINVIRNKKSLFAIDRYFFIAFLGTMIPSFSYFINIEDTFKLLCIQLYFQLYTPHPDKLQYFEMLHNLIDKKTSAKNFNIEINADMLGTLALFLSNQPIEIMPLMLMALRKNFYKSFSISSQFTLDNVKSLKSHPNEQTRIAYCLELTEKLKAAQENLLKSYELTMKNELNLASKPQ